MSLFGDDDLPSRPKPSPSLFDDDLKPDNNNKGGSSLFADESYSNDSPWGLPTPKKAARGSLVKSLLPAESVPDAYIDAYDALLESGERAGNGISLSTVKKLLGDSGLEEGDQAKILEIVSQPGEESAGLGRSEFNVLFALIGLAQEHDDITLDSVDERKRSEFPRLAGRICLRGRIILTCFLRQTCPFLQLRYRRRLRSRRRRRPNPNNLPRANGRRHPLHKNSPRTHI